MRQISNQQCDSALVFRQPPADRLEVDCSFVCIMSFQSVLLVQRADLASMHGSVPGHGCNTMKKRILYLCGICAREVSEGKLKRDIAAKED